jgi:protein-disulfide isomerase
MQFSWYKNIGAHSLVAVVIIIFSTTILVMSYASKQDNGAEQESQNAAKATLLLSGHLQPLPLYGSQIASTTLVMFGDAACQYCRSLYPKLKGLVDISDGTVNLIYRPAPLLGIRSEVYTLTELIGECIAHDTSRYHVFLETLFQSLPKQTQLLAIPTSTITFAAQTDEAELAACLEKNEQIERLIDEHHAAAAVLGVTSIPHTFVVSSTKTSDIVGDQRLEVFEALVRDHTTNSPTTP